MGLAAVLVIFLVGLAVGVLSGLIGIGGGVLIVPFLYFFYAHPEWFGVPITAELATVVAHATSLFVIVPTSLRGAYTYHQAGLIEWRAVWPIGTASILSAAAGAWIATILPAPALKVAFGLLLVASAVQLVRGRSSWEEGTPAGELRLTAPIAVGIGIVVGLFSALLGVGGGIISIPLLIHVIQLDVRRVAATSIAIIAITATAGTLAYMIGSADVGGMPPWSLGYVHLSAGIIMFAGSVLSVRWGSALNQRLAPRTLSLLFAAVFAAIGLRLLIANLIRLETNL